MNYAPPNQVDRYTAWKYIKQEIKTYLGQYNASITYTKMARLLNDYMLTISALYPKDDARCIRSEVYGYLKDLIYDAIQSEDGELMLSEIPSLKLQYRWLDSRTLLYRLVYIGQVKIGQWQTAKKYGFQKLSIARYAADTLIDLLDLTYLKEDAYE
jgi:hypothetical protein